jgi:ubiquinone/menaquinone biosynthesis C-methylase UbiE
VWEESSLEWAKMRHLPFLIKKLLNPKRIFFIDIDKKLVKLARKNMKYFGFNESHVYNGDVAKMPFSQNKFDIVIDFSTTDHLPNKQLKKTIKEICRVLKKGGICITYHLNSEYFNIREFNRGHGEYFPSFPREVKILKKLLVNENFEILREGYCFPFFADYTLFLYYRILFNRIYFFLPEKLLFSFLNSPKLNLFFYVIARKSK